MADLRLTEQEYQLVCLVLEHQPLAIELFLDLCQSRLRLSEDETRVLLDELTGRGVLTLAGGAISSLASQDEVNQTILDREFDRYTNHQSVPPAKEPEPAALSAEPREETVPEASPKQPFFRRNNPFLWGGLAVALALAAAVGLIVRMALFQQSYPCTVQFEDGRTFTVETAPDTAVQRAALQYLEEYARDSVYLDSSTYLTFRVMDMEEYMLEPDWAENLHLEGLSGSSVADIASTHYGTVIFATVEQTCNLRTGLSSAFEYFNGTYICRLYLSGDEENGYTVADMAKSPADQYTEFCTKTFEAGGKTFTISFTGMDSTPYYELSWVTLSDGIDSQLLYLTEAPQHIESMNDFTPQDLNGDGYPDLNFFVSNGFNLSLCYLYALDSGSYQLYPKLCGYGIQFDPTFPGAVQYYTYSSNQACKYFSIFENGTELVELARWESTALLFSYYMDGELVQHYQYNASDFLLSDQLTVTAYWENIVVQAALRYGCLSLPAEPADGEDYSTYALLAEYPGDGLAFYRTSSGLLLIADNGQYQVIPTYIYGWDSWYWDDFDGDGQRELMIPDNYCYFAPQIIRKEDEQWVCDNLIDLSGLITDFDENNTVTWQDNTVTLTYDGQYGTCSYAQNLSAAVMESLAAWESLYPGLTSGDQTGSLILPYESSFQEETGLLALTFPVLLRASYYSSQPTASAYFYYTVTFSFGPDGQLYVSALELTGI